MPQPDLSGIIARIDQAGARAAVEQLAGSGLLERRSVIIISVDAVQARTGDRWPRKRDDVWGYVSRKCEEYLSVTDIRQKVSDTDFLLGISTEAGVAAQAISLKILEEVLNFFLGEARTEDLKLKVVTAIDGDGLACEDVDLAQVAAARRGSSTACDGEQIDENEVRDRSPVSFVIASGETVRVDFALEPLVNLRLGIPAGLRVQPTIRMVATGAVVPTYGLGRLSDEDVAFIDKATVRFGSLFLRKDRRAQVPIILPVSFRTMGLSKGRNIFVGVEGMPAQHLKNGAMIELVDVGHGTPAGRLAEVVSLLSQLSRGVTVRVCPDRNAIDPVRGSRIRGVAIDVGDLALEPDPLRALFRTMALQMQGQAPAIIAQGLPAPSWLSQVHALGFTHATLRPRTRGRRSAAERPPLFIDAPHPC
jgi:hypothetical protein